MSKYVGTQEYANLVSKAIQKNVSAMTIRNRITSGDLAAKHEKGTYLIDTEANPPSEFKKKDAGRKRASEVAKGI